MSTFSKSFVLGLGLVAGLGVAAQAQTAYPTYPTQNPSVAALPPVQGPRASSYNSIVPGQEHMAVVPSGAYPGPGPGAGTGQMPPRFEKPADWDQNAALHPYTTNGMGPKPH